MRDLNALPEAKVCWGRTDQGMSPAPTVVQTATALDQDGPVELDGAEVKPYHPDPTMEAAIEANRLRQKDLKIQYRDFVDREVQRMESAPGSAGGVVPTYSQWLKNGYARPMDPTVKIVGDSRIQDLRDSKYAVISALSANQYTLRDKESGATELWRGSKLTPDGISIKYGPNYLSFMQVLTAKQSVELSPTAALHSQEHPEEIVVQDPTQEMIFNAWRDFGHVAKELGAVIQNDLSRLAPSDIASWNRRVDLVRLEFEHLVEQTRALITRPKMDLPEVVGGALEVLNTPGQEKWSDVSAEAIQAVFDARRIHLRNAFRDTSGLRPELDGFPFSLVGLADLPAGTPEGTLPGFVIRFPNGHRETVDAIDIIDTNSL